MATTVIEGLQWGDEGKGKITDYLATKSDVVVRYQGGNNAGHTIVHDGHKFALRSLPSGIINKNIINVIADGVVLNPFMLMDEIKYIKDNGIEEFNLFISNRCHLIMPYHLDLDGAYEGLLSDAKIGTTKKGIGPCYMDKMARRGIRAGDLLEKEFLKQRLTAALVVKNLELRSLGLKEYDVDELYNSLLEVGEVLKDHIVDTTVLINKAYDEGKKILFEGAQGLMLDIDRGTYPYVTSSSPSSNYVPQGAGISPKKIDHIVGIVKAYTTRVGNGPFPTELDNELGNLIREKGHEYGTVTRRPRRVGFLDLVLLKRNVMMTGATSIALTLFDVLCGIGDLKVCVKYELDGKEIDTIPATNSAYLRAKPIYVDMKGFDFNKDNIHSFDDLPKEAQDYIRFIENYLGVKVSILSVGSDRKDTLILGDL